MSIEVWPPTLQQLLSESNFGIDEGDTTVRTDMDTGLAKIRRRYTQGIDSVSGSVYLTKDQYTTFRNFFDTTLNAGINTFNFNHPITGDVTEYRFKGTPKYNSIGGGNFTVQFTWETLP